MYIFGATSQSCPFFAFWSIFPKQNAYAESRLGLLFCTQSRPTAQALHCRMIPVIACCRIILGEALNRCLPYPDEVFRRLLVGELGTSKFDQISPIWEINQSINLYLLKFAIKCLYNSECYYTARPIWNKDG